MRQTALAFLFISLFSHAQQGQLSVKAMQDDFDVLQKALEEVHGGIYRHSTKEWVDQHFLAQRSRLGSVKSRYEFIGLVSETLAGLRDGHLRLEYDPQTTADLSSAKLFPLTIALEGERAVIVFNETPTSSSPQPGMELLSVNGISVKDLVERIFPKVSGDGYIETGRLWRIERNFPTYYHLFVAQDSEYEITFRDTSGAAKKIKLTGVTNAERTDNRTRNSVNKPMLDALPPQNRPNIQLKFYAGNIAHLSIQGFQGSDFKSEIDTAIGSIIDSKASSVILDLRGNGGGVDEYGAWLVSQFTDKPFRYFDHIHLRSINPSFTTWREHTYEELRTGTSPDPKGGYLVTKSLHSGVGVQSPAKNPFKGKLFVLLNGGTFSTAADVTATLHNMKRAVFIGEESGGGYEGNTSGLNARVNLPNSGLSLRISLYDYWNAVLPKEKSRGTTPDYPVEDAILERLHGNDAPLNLAVKMANGR